MVAIVSSQIAEDAAQADGRRWITEVHVDDAGVAHRQVYLAARNADAVATLAGNAAAIESNLNAPPPTDGGLRLSADMIRAGVAASGGKLGDQELIGILGAVTGKSVEVAADALTVKGG